MFGALFVKWLFLILVLPEAPAVFKFTNEYFLPEPSLNVQFTLSIVRFWLPSNLTAIRHEALASPPEILIGRVDVAEVP